MLGSIIVVGVLTRCALIHYVCDLKVSQMDVPSRLNQKRTLYEFKLDHKAKADSEVDHCTVIGFQNLAPNHRHKSIELHLENIRQGWHIRI